MIKGVFGGVIVTDNFLNLLSLAGPQNTSLLGTVTVIYDVSCFFGACAAFYRSKRLGRKRTILLGTTIMTIGAILQISLNSAAWMIVGRVIADIGNHINTATVPVWQSETSTFKWCGELVIIEMIMNIAGFFLSN